jgi:Flp pilus assembly protein TadG
MAPVVRTGRFRSARGAELVEFALILPLLLFVMLGLVDFGFMFQRFEVVTNAAREGARIAVLPGYATADVLGRVQSYLTTGGVAATVGNTTVAVTDVTIPTGGPGPALPAKRVQVTYASPYLFLGPIAGWFGGSFTTANLTGVAVMRLELAP